MPRIRNIITAVSFVALSAVSLAAGVQAISRGLPEALPSNVTVLMAALAAENVASQPRWVKLKFAGRAQRELSDNVDWSAELARLDEAQRERLVENIAELARTSFDANLDEYFRLREGRRRRDFLDAQIKMITRWATLLDRASRASDEPLAGLAAMQALFARAGEWYQGATPEELERLRTFQKALVDRMVEKFKRGFRPNEG